MKSSFLSINLKDLGKGFAVSVITSLVAALSVSIDHGAFPATNDLKNIGLASLAAGVSYLVKNLFTNSDDKLLAKEDK